MTVEGIISVTSATHRDALIELREVPVWTVDLGALRLRPIHLVSCSTHFTNILQVVVHTEFILDDTGSVDLNVPDIAVESGRNLYAKVVLSSVAHLAVATYAN